MGRREVAEGQANEDCPLPQHCNAGRLVAVRTVPESGTSTSATWKGAAGCRPSRPARGHLVGAFLFALNLMGVHHGI